MQKVISESKEQINDVDNVGESYDPGPFIQGKHEVAFYFDQDEFVKSREQEGIVEYVPISWELTGDTDKILSILKASGTGFNYLAEACNEYKQVIGGDSVNIKLKDNECGFFVRVGEDGRPDIDVYTWLKILNEGEEVYTYQLYKNKKDVLPQIIIDKITKEFGNFYI